MHKNTHVQGSSRHVEHIERRRVVCTGGRWRTESGGCTSAPIFRPRPATDEAARLGTSTVLPQCLPSPHTTRIPSLCSETPCFKASLLLVHSIQSSLISTLASYRHSSHHGHCQDRIPSHPSESEQSMEVPASEQCKTLAKPISNQLKTQAKQGVILSPTQPSMCLIPCVDRHERFRSFCMGLAQRMYQTEVRLRTNLLGEPAKHVRPLSETRYALVPHVHEDVVTRTHVPGRSRMAQTPSPKVSCSRSPRG